MARKPKERAGQSCFSCACWSGKVQAFHDIGESRGTCLWLVDLAVTHASIGIPEWVTENPPVRLTYDDDGRACGGWSAIKDPRPG